MHAGWVVMLHRRRGRCPVMVQHNLQGAHPVQQEGQVLLDQQRAVGSAQRSLACRSLETGHGQGGLMG